MRKIGLKWNIQLRAYQLKVLAGLLSCCENEEEMRSVLNTILTNSEKEAIAQRVGIITKIRKGIMYYEIEGQLGVSPSTISKAIDIYLKHGDDNKNFNTVLQRYKEPEFKYKSNRKKYADRSRIFNAGIRSLRKEDEDFQKRIQENKNRNRNQR